VASRGDRVADPKTRSLVERSARLRLVVLGGEVLATHALPVRGTLTIGRGAECDIAIDDTSISRVHARLVVGTEITVEDLGSSNATRVRGERLEPGAAVNVALDEVITLGAIGVVIQQHAPVQRERTLWGHGYFELRLVDECTRARRTNATFALLRIRADRDVVDQLSAAVRDIDVIGTYAPREWEILAIDATTDDAARIARAIASSVPGAKVASAMFPADGDDAWKLESAVAARLDRDARPAAPVMPAAAGPMTRLFELADRVAVGDISVLVLGETGSGKELIAERIHDRSRRAGKPLVKLNCAAVPEQLIESELFGYEKGAFTGATGAKPGLLEEASGGSVFLDEIGELPAATQAKLLRVLEQREIWRVGALKAKPIDVRFIAATHRDLEAAIAAGRFREDLYFRLAGVTLQVPPLRQRPDELEPLVRFFTSRAAAGLGRPTPRVSPAALALLRAYRWPGNIRELRNVIERATLLCDGEIDVAHLPEDRMSRPAAAPSAESSPLDTVKSQAAQLEREAIEDALSRSSGNQTKAAKLLGISRRTLTNKLNLYNLARPRKS
jgi:DNA-binding NtrC family response regulator